MKKKLLVIFLFITIPIWILPFAFYFMIRETWQAISKFIDRKVK